jgi:hypothetical protein
MFTISDTSTISFSNLAFNVSSNAAIYGQNVTGLVVSQCQFQNLGQEGIKLLRSSGSVITSSTFNDIGNSAMLLDGDANKTSIEASKNSITRVSWYNKVYSAGITISGFSVIVRGNILREGSHGGIYLRANSTNQWVEGNDVGHFVQDIHDFGSIYFFAGNLKPRNNTFINNYVHDGGHNPLIYIDNYSSSNRAHGNLVTRGEVGIFVHAGQNNIVTNNFIHEVEVPYKFTAAEPISPCNFTNIIDKNIVLVPEKDMNLPLPADEFWRKTAEGRVGRCPSNPPGYNQTAKRVVPKLASPTLNTVEDRTYFSQYFQFPNDFTIVRMPRSPTTFYIDAIEGLDTNNGTAINAPVKTIRAAQSKITEILTTCSRSDSNVPCPLNITVLLSRSAPHIVNTTFLIDHTISMPFTFQSYGPRTGPAQITTGYTIPGSCFTNLPSTDPNIKLFDNDVASSIKVCDLGTVTSTANLKHNDLRICELGYGIDSNNDAVSKCLEPQVYVSRSNNPSKLEILHPARWPNRQDNSQIPRITLDSEAQFQNGTLPILNVLGDAGANGGWSTNPLVSFEFGGLPDSKAAKWKNEKHMLIDGFLTIDGHAWNRVNASFVGFNATKKAATLRISRRLGKTVDKVSIVLCNRMGSNFSQ